MHFRIETLPYDRSSHSFLRKLRVWPHAFALQSCHASGQRFDLFGADPHTRVTHSNDVTSVAKPSTTYRSRECPFAILQQELDHAAGGLSNTLPEGMPFGGGAVGYFGYELGHRVERLPHPRPDDLDIPEMNVGIYDWFVIVDHAEQTTHLVARGNVPNVAFERIKSHLARPGDAPGNFARTSEIRSSFTRDEYDTAMARIHDYIVNGDCYQVNLAQRFETAFEGDPIGLYETLLDAQQPPYAACLVSPHAHVLSFSPERFIRVDGRLVTTQPIKGTRPRGKSSEADRQLAGELCRSEKDRAENLMIVDLLRNDLGKCCATGSVTVDKLFELQSFPNVHHLVSTISGRLRDNVKPLELLKAAFPGGSITGAPKIRAMEIIHELESVRRGPYCGAIGYVSYNGNLDTNLSIRTMVCAGERAYYWGGGGIVADSTAADEYAESLAKVDFIRRSLSTRSPHDLSSPAARRTR